MTNLTTTNFDPALKQLYSDKNLKYVTYQRRPIYGLMPKFESFGGRNMPVVLKYGNPMGRSSTFSTAQSNASATSLEDFLLTRVKDYSVATIDGEVIEASRGDNMAFMAALKVHIDSARDALADSLESQIPRSGTGSIAQAGTVSTTSCTLKDINDVVHFDVNMEVVASAADGGTLRSGNATVTGVNRVSGILTTDSNWTSQITSFAADDYMYAQGDAANNSTNVRISGFAAWVPATAPSASESYFGVDRSVDGRLYGQYHDGSSQLIEEALIDAQSKAAREQGNPDTVFINHVSMRRLIKELGSKKEYCEVNATGPKGIVANVGYAAVVVHGDNGNLKVVAANKCQSEIAWVLDLSSWKLASLGDPTGFAMHDGNKILRQASADGYEVRLRFYGNACVNHPNANVHCALPSTS